MPRKASQECDAVVCSQGPAAVWLSRRADVGRGILNRDAVVESNEIMHDSNPTTTDISPITGSRKVSKKGFIIYEVTVSHPELGLKEIFRGQFPMVLERKASAKAAQWDEMWIKQKRRDTRRPVADSGGAERTIPVDRTRLKLGTSS